jgi:hypothetical protein
MTDEAVKIIITVEVEGRKLKPRQVKVNMNAKIDESFRQEMLLLERELFGIVLEVADERLWKTVAQDWKNAGREERQIVTSVGWVPFKRRVFIDEAGKRRKPLDEMLALKPRGHYSQGAALKASYLVSELPYRKTSPVLSWLLGTEISHSTIGRLMLSVGQSVDAEEEEARNRVFEQGEVPEAGKIPAKVLYGESDGVYISLQREQQKKTEVRVGILYTGKKAIAEGRKRLENKVVVTKIVENSQEWQETMLKAAYENYDLDSTLRMITGGDGGQWVRKSFDFLDIPQDFVLDRFHLYRDARRAFGFCAQTDTWIYKIRTEGLESVLPEMLTMLSKAPQAQAKRMRRFIQYLVNNREGLLDPDCRAHLHPGFERLGAIEGNVDKLVVRRLKGRGRSWSIAGAKAMLAICRHQSELREGAFKPFRQQTTEKPSKPKSRKTDYGEWLQAGVPAFYYGHKNRPWAKILRDRIHPHGVL